MPSARAQALILLPAETFAKRHSDPKRRSDPNCHSERSEESKAKNLKAPSWTGMHGRFRLGAGVVLLLRTRPDVPLSLEVPVEG